MSQRLVTTDDHTGDEIVTRIDDQRASLTLARNDHSITWPDMHLNDESWDGLIKLIRDYLPTVQTVSSPDLDEADGPDAADEASAAADELRAQATAQALDDEAEQAQQAQAQALAVQRVQAQQATNESAPSGTMTQAQQKALSASRRAWWYALDAKTLKALNLKTPDRSVTRGKLPPAVVAAYDASHA